MKFKMKLSKWLNNPTFSKEFKEAIENRFEKPDEVEVERRFFAPTIEPKGESLKEGERAIIQYVSTRDLDRDNEILMPGGCDLSEFKKAPQVLWGHNYSLPPIGKDIWIKKDELGIKAKTEYAETERGEEVWKLRKGRFLNTSSVGFLPLETTTPEKDDWEETCDELKETWPGFSRIKKNVRRIIKKWLLLEHSDVSVPANINALTVAVAKGEIDLSDGLREELNMPDIKAIKDELKKEMKDETIIKCKVCSEHNTFIIPDDGYVHYNKCKKCDNYIDNFGKKMENKLSDEQKENIKKQAALEVEYENAEPFNNLKPFPNDHACRIKKPGLFQEDSFRRVSRSHDGKKYSIIMGRLKGETTLTEQAYRYPKKTWPVAQARKHCKGHDGIMFEPARESRSAVRYIIRPLPKQETPEQRKAEIEQAVRDKFDEIKGKV